MTATRDCANKIMAAHWRIFVDSLMAQSFAPRGGSGVGAKLFAGALLTEPSRDSPRPTDRQTYRLWNTRTKWTGKRMMNQ
jgi:hypothetical protein